MASHGREAGRAPLDEAVQKKIKEKLQKERRETQIADYLAKALEDAHVWTIFDEGNQIANTQNGPTQR